MTKLHTTDFYMDGHIAIPYCKICSAEGDRLLDECSGVIEVVEPEWMEQKRIDNLIDLRESLK